METTVTTPAAELLDDEAANALPLQGVRVVEFCHVVMGPTCGLVLADLGAEVIKVEPLDGDHTRKLVASGEIKSIDQVLESGRPIKEPQIVDAFLPDLEDEVLDIAMMQRMTDSGRRV